MLQFPVDGYIFIGSSITRKILNCLLEDEVPAICTLNPNFPELNHVGMGFQAAHRNVIRILKKSGCSRIAFFGYARQPDFENYLEGIFRIFQTELGADFDRELFTVMDSKEYYASYGERYHQVAADEVARRWRKNPPHAVITIPESVPRFRKYFPEIRFAVFCEGTNIPENCIVVQSDFSAILAKAAHRMMEIFAGDRMITETEIPFKIYQNNELFNMFK